MKNNEYWEKRKAMLMYEQMEKAEKTSRKISKVYAKSKLNIQEKCNKVFNNFQKEYGLTRKEAKLVIKSMDDLNSLKELERVLTNRLDKEKIKSFIDEISSSGYAFRIKQFEDLQKYIDNITREIYKAENKLSTRHYVNLMNSGYNRSIYEIQSKMGAYFSFNELDSDKILKLLNTRWEGFNYSQRIWNNTTRLAGTLKEEFLISLMTGRSSSEVARIVEDKFNVGALYARRLVRTESAFYQNEIEALSYEEADIEKYRFVATLDLKTSKICQEHDNKIYKLKDKKVGVNYPPLHPWCRSTTIAHFEDEELTTRRARDPQTGKTMTVPANMNYEQWYDKYVKGNDKAVLNEKMIKNRNVDFKQYEKYRNVGVNVPKRLDDFQKIKYNNIEQYNKLQDNYFVKKRLHTGEFGSTINVDKQKAHNYITRDKDKSYLFENVKAQDLFNKYAGTGIVEKNKNGRTHIEICKADGIIGYCLYAKSQTDMFKIHHSKNRTHIVPYKKKGDVL